MAMYEGTRSHIADHPLLHPCVTSPSAIVSAVASSSNAVGEKSSRTPTTPTVAAYADHMGGDVWVDWESYITIHSDLAHMQTSDDALKHYVDHGSHENRSYLLLPRVLHHRDGYHVALGGTVTATMIPTVRRRRTLKRLRDFVAQFPPTSSNAPDMAQACTTTTTLSQRPAILLVMHGVYTRGGGTGTFVRRLSELLLSQYDIVILHAWTKANHFRVSINDGVARQYDQWHALASDLTAMRLCGALMVHFLGFDGEKLFQLIHHTLQIPYILTLHDYFWISSSIPVPEVVANFGAISRAHFAQFFDHAKAIVSPSADLRTVYAKHTNADITVIPHCTLQYDEDVNNIASVPPLDLHVDASANATVITKDCSTHPLTVLITGTMYIGYKGPGKIIAAARACPHIRFVVLGDMETPKPPCANLEIRGRFKEGDIATLIHNARADLIWTPGPYRESYSYNLDHHLISNVPLLCPDFPIYRERTAQHYARHRVAYYRDTGIPELQALAARYNNVSVSENPASTDPIPASDGIATLQFGNVTVAHIAKECAEDYMDLVHQHFGTMVSNLRAVLSGTTWLNIAEPPRP